MASFTASVVNEDAAHRFGGGAEEVRAVLPGLVWRIHELEPRFVNERGRLERMAGGFARHLVRGHAAQFVIDERQQFLRRFGVALFDGG